MVPAVVVVPVMAPMVPAPVMVVVMTPPMAAVVMVMVMPVLDGLDQTVAGRFGALRGRRRRSRSGAQPESDRGGDEDLAKHVSLHLHVFKGMIGPFDHASIIVGLG
jgi:hypothetical protein